MAWYNLLLHHWSLQVAWAARTAHAGMRLKIFDQPRLELKIELVLPPETSASHLDDAKCWNTTYQRHPPKVQAPCKRCMLANSCSGNSMMLQTRLTCWVYTLQLI
jgi:hypothetical protein